MISAKKPSLPTARNSFWRIWNSTEKERRMPLDCDALLPDAEDVLHRAIDVNAPVSYLYTRLCQLHLAPYSYDLLDNWGRKSPAEAQVTHDSLESGVKIMTIFSLTKNRPAHSMTIEMTDELGLMTFGNVVVTYRTLDLGKNRSRLLIRLRLIYPTRGFGVLSRFCLPFGDWFMCEKQLRVLKKYAEMDFRANRE